MSFANSTRSKIREFYRQLRSDLGQGPLAVNAAHRLLASSIDAHMIEQGYKKLGQGDIASAWQRKGEQRIVKISRKDRARPMTMWVDYVSKNSSQHFPVFYGREVFEHGGHDWVKVEMDRYKPLPTPVQKQVAAAWDYINKTKPARPGDNLLDVMLRVAQYGLKHNLHEDYVQRGRVKNLMAHGSQIIIVDPWSGE